MYLGVGVKVRGSVQRAGVGRRVCRQFQRASHLQQGRRNLAGGWKVPSEGESPRAKQRSTNKVGLTVPKGHGADRRPPPSLSRRPNLEATLKGGLTINQPHVARAPEIAQRLFERVGESGGRRESDSGRRARVVSSRPSPETGSIGDGRFMGTTTALA